MKNDDLNKLNNLNNSKKIDEVIDEDKYLEDRGDEDDEVKDEKINNEVEKITHEERMAFGKEIQKLIDTYSIYKNDDYYFTDHNNFNEFDTCPIRLSRKLFQSKIFRLCSVIIQKYIDVNYKYFNSRYLEKLSKIIDRALKIDYRKEKDAMKKIKYLIHFSKIEK